MDHRDSNIDRLRIAAPLFLHPEVVVRLVFSGRDTSTVCLVVGPHKGQATSRRPCSLSMPAAALPVQASAILQQLAIRGILYGRDTVSAKLDPSSNRRLFIQKSMSTDLKSSSMQLSSGRGGRLLDQPPSTKTAAAADAAETLSTRGACDDARV